MAGDDRPGYAPADADFERRTRESFAKQGAMAHLGAVLERVAPGRVIRSGRSITVASFDVHVEKGGRRTHCATGLQTIMRIVGRTGVQG